MVFDCLHDNDGIVDNQANRQDKPQKRQCIDGEPEHGKDDERTTTVPTAAKPKSALLASKLLNLFRIDSLRSPEKVEPHQVHSSR